jgi:hypothetical protein
MLFFTVILPLTGLLVICLARPVLPLKSLTFIALQLGFRDAAGKFDELSQLRQAEQDVRDRFDDMPVWIELPDTHRDAFVQTYFDSYREPGSIALFPTSPTTFKACVPSKMRNLLTVEKLNAAPKPESVSPQYHRTTRPAR